MEWPNLVSINLQFSFSKNQNARLKTKYTDHNFNNNSEGAWYYIFLKSPLHYKYQLSQSSSDLEAIENILYELVYELFFEIGHAFVKLYKNIFHKMFTQTTSRPSRVAMLQIKEYNPKLLVPH